MNYSFIYSFKIYLLSSIWTDIILDTGNTVVMAQAGSYSHRPTTEVILHDLEYG